MSSSRYKIAEQVSRLLNGGNPAQTSWAKLPEIYEAIGQVLNKLVKLDYLQVTLPSGETVPTGYMVGTYPNIPVSSDGNVSSCLLPAIPIALPRDVGLSMFPNSYSPATSNRLNSQFIPIPQGHSVLLQNQPMISNLLGQIFYERKGSKVIFGTDITQPPSSITQVLAEMAVLDMTQYGDYDLLPIPPDMESECATQVYKMFSNERAPNKVDDPIANVTHENIGIK